MLKTYAPVLLILLAVIAGYWLLASPPGEPTPDVDWVEGDPADPSDPASLGATGLSADGVAPRGPEKKRGKPYRTVDPRTLPKGTLYVTPVGPDDKPIDDEATHLRIYVEPVRAKGFPTRLGTWDKETGTYRFERVLAGDVNVRLYADHIARKIQRVRVRANQDNRITIPVELAGAIQYDVIAYDKKRPDPVRVELFDAQDKPVRAWYRISTATRLTSPKQVEVFTGGPEGIIFGIPPGSYRLKVTSEAEEWDDAKVEVVAAETKAVSLEVRR